MSIWLMAALGGLLATQFVNPVLIYRFFSELFHFIKDKLSKNGEAEFDMGIYYPKKFIVHQLLLGIITFLLLVGWHLLDSPDRTISAMISSLWLPAVIHFVYNLLTEADNFKCHWGKREFKNRTFDDCIFGVSFIGTILVFIISVGIILYTPIYKTINPEDTTITILEEEKVPTLSVDLATTLEKVNVLEGYSYEEAIKRGDKIIIPMSRADSVSVMGYAMIENDNVTIIEKELKYTPSQFNNRRVQWVARDYMPKKVFFSENWSFQLDDKGNVYYVNVYGEYKSLRAGRDIEGIIAVNASTGECTTYSLEEIPKWVNGISE